MKTTFKKAQQFVAAAGKYLTDFPEETKLKYAIQKMGPRIDAITSDYVAEFDDIELEHANTDANGSVLFKIVDNRRQYDFTKEGLKKSNEAKKVLFEVKEFDLKPHFCTDIPEGFPDEYRPFFEGFVLPVPDKA